MELRSLKPQWGPLGTMMHSFQMNLRSLYATVTEVASHHPTLSVTQNWVATK